MRKNNTGVIRYYQAVWLALGIFLIGILVFAAYVYAEKQIDRENDRLILALQVADELRQSSDDLTRMVRTYVLTGDDIYKQHYQEILDIRRGNKPRPVDYQDVYWDLVLADDQRPRPMGSAIATRDRMQQLDISSAELAKLSEAKAFSDALTRIEFAAMALMEGKPELGSAKRERAIQMLHDPVYHEAKANIMRPLAEFNQMLKQRISRNVAQATQTALYLRLSVILMATLQVLSLGLVYRSLNNTLGMPISQLHDYIMRLGKGGVIPPPTHVPEQAENSIVHWLSQMQGRLYESDIQRRQTEATLAQKTSDLEVLNHELKRLNRKDALTGLQNRLSADERLRQEFNRYKRSPHSEEGYTLLFADIDHFKKINDSCGHETGDKVLRQLAVVLEGSLRQTDFLARFGGEEFLILLPATNLEGATIYAEKIRQAVIEHSFPIEGQASISIGITSVRKEDDSEFDAVHRADVALYRAKNAGRNRIEVFAS